MSWCINHNGTIEDPDGTRVEDTERDRQEYERERRRCQETER